MAYIAWIGALQYSPAIGPAELTGYNLKIPCHLSLLKSAGMHIRVSYLILCECNSRKFNNRMVNYVTSYFNTYLQLTFGYRVYSYHYLNLVNTHIQLIHNAYTAS